MRILNKELLNYNIEARVNDDLQKNKFFGTSVIVKQFGNIVHKGNYGTASPDKNDFVKDDTIFRLASMTKPITSVAVMCLCDAGMLSLNDLIETFVPEYKNLQIAKIEDGRIQMCGAAEVKPTIKHLLTHTSGIGSGDIGNLQYSLMTEADKNNLDNTVRYFSNQPLAFEPYTQSCYSAFAAFDILAYIVEIISEEKYGDFLAKHIFEKCNMADTTFEPDNDKYGRMIKMHNIENGESVVGKTYPNCIFEKFPCSHHLAGAGLVSTASDYSNFAEMLLNKGKFNGNTIISPQAVEMISRVQIDKKIQQGSQQWGLGVRVITGENRLPIGSYGWSGAYGTHFWIDPKNQITAVYMKNSRYDGGSGAITASNFEIDVYNSLQ